MNEIIRKNNCALGWVITTLLLLCSVSSVCVADSRGRELIEASVLSEYVKVGKSTSKLACRVQKSARNYFGRLSQAEIVADETIFKRVSKRKFLRPSKKRVQVCLAAKDNCKRLRQRLKRKRAIFRGCIKLIADDDDGSGDNNDGGDGGSGDPGVGDPGDGNPGGGIGDPGGGSPGDGKPGGGSPGGGNQVPATPEIQSASPATPVDFAGQASLTISLIGSNFIAPAQGENTPAMFLMARVQGSTDEFQYPFEFINNEQISIEVPSFVGNVEFIPVIIYQNAEGALETLRATEPFLVNFIDTPQIRAPTYKGTGAFTTCTAAGLVFCNGDLRQSQPVEFWFKGPGSSESASQNPFLNYHLAVDFTDPGGNTVTVPGFFDGDGAGDGTGDIWKVRFSPPLSGEWQYTVRMYQGENIAVTNDPSNGAIVAPHGLHGIFHVLAFDQNAEGFLKWGHLEQNGKHYLKFAHGPYFIKTGTDSPENFLAYKGFDNTVDQGNLPTGSTFVHEYATHVDDWTDDDPNWTSSDTGYEGKAIIGALNYLSSKGVNSVYFLPMNLGGDGQDTYPFINPAGGFNNNTRYDISKLHQWNIVLEHAQRKGITSHFVLAETETGNETWLGSGLSIQRKLFFRELIARFSYLLAIKWNLSEENDFSVSELRSFFDYFRQHDPTPHPITFHIHPNNFSTYNSFGNDPRLTVTSIQYSPNQAGNYVEASLHREGKTWVVDMDENNPAETGLTDSNANDLRKRVLYDVLFSGGSIEWYFGYHSLPLGGDIRAENFRTREQMWNFSQIGREILESGLSFWNFEPRDGLLAGETNHPEYGDAEVFGKAGEGYLIYYPSTLASGALDLRQDNTSYSAQWINPRTGASRGSSFTVNGGSIVSLPVSPDGSTSGGSVFQESNGIVVVEVESHAPSGDWVSENSLSGFAGNSYYRWAGANLYSSPGHSILRYEVSVSQSVTYQFRLHNRHDHPDPSLSNDCYIRVDGGAWQKVFSNYGTASVAVWNWESRFDDHGARPLTSYALDAGNHVFEISGRSSNFMIDRFHLYRSTVSNPLDLSRPESSRGGTQRGSEEDWILKLTPGSN